MVYIYKETRVSLDWATNDGIIKLSVPGFDPSSASTNQADDTAIANDTTNALIETSVDEFPPEYLATSSSVLFRAIHQSPRAILWRVIENGKTLVLMPLDVARPAEGQGSVAVAYHIQFPHSIPAGCVTFFDVPESHTVVAFVLTTAYTLYTLNLQQTFFTTQDEPSRLQPGWCHKYAPSTFILRAPHFLKAVSGDTVLASLQDGGLLRLDRIIQTNDPRNFHGYKENVFSDGSYFKSIKTIVRWGSTNVRYGSKSISESTVVSIALTYRYSLLFTVSINHQLKAWSMEKGTVLGTYDLLNEPASSAPSIRNFLEPTPAHLVSLIDFSMEPRHMFYLLTLSPAGSGTFKLWAGTDDGTPGFTRLIDLYPNNDLRLEPPTSNVMWVVADFGIASFSSSDPSLISMWLLWKSNTSSRTQTVTFKLDKMGETFNSWVNATPESLLSVKPRTPSGGGPDFVSNYWMDWLFQPGRFSDSVFDRGLEVYRKNFISGTNKGKDLEYSQPGDSQQFIICKAVQTVVNIKKENASAVNDDDSTRREFDSQWSTFYRICNELDRQRIEALSLAVDPASGLAFVANTDTINVVRKCSESESIARNLATASAEDIKLLASKADNPSETVFRESVAASAQVLVQAALALKESLTTVVFDECVLALQDEVTNPPEASVFERIDAIYDRCFDAQGGLPHNLYEQLCESIRDIDNLENTFKKVCESIQQSHAYPGSSKLTTFGEKLLLRGSQEIVHVNYTLLFDLTLLLVFVHSSSGVEIENLDPFDALYLQLIQLLREYEILSWLSKNTWTPSAEDVEDEMSLRTSLASIRRSNDDNLPQIHNFPVLQILLDENAGPPPSIMGSGPVTLTTSIQRFLAATEIGDFSSAITLIASRLLKMNAVRLMGEFMPYLPTTHWGGYLKARMALSRKEWKDADQLFKDIASGVASPKQPSVFFLEALFTPVELASICAGLPRYYFHVAALFEKSKKYDEVVVFAKLAYTALPETLNEEDKALRSDILSRQFSAALRVPDYDAAYSALMNYSDKPLQRKALKSLIISMCEHHAAETLCGFEFSGLHEEVDESLEQQCEQVEDVRKDPQYHKILYSWRMSKENRRGAASALYDYLKKLQSTKTVATRFSTNDVRNIYLALLNVLSCIPKEQAYIFTRLHPDQESRTGVNFVDGTKVKRRVVTIDNIREEYQDEMLRMHQYLSGGVFF